MTIIIVGLHVKFLHHGQTQTLPVLADDDGLHTGKLGKVVRKSLLNKQRIYVRDELIVSWADVTDCEITTPDLLMFAGSSVQARSTLVTLKTKTTQLVLTIKHNDPAQVRTKLGPYFARIEAR